jgi:hypothetical protein
MQAVGSSPPAVRDAAAAAAGEPGPTFLGRGAVERLGFVAVALAGLWLAIGAVLGWLG